MDDLLDLDWDRKPVQAVSQNSPARNSSNTSSYNFDALTRSLPQSSVHGNGGNGMGSQPGAGARGMAKPSKDSDARSTPDAFSSLLGFDNGIASGASLSNNISMAERLRREREQRSGVTPRTAASSQPQKEESAAWDGLDSLLGSSKAASRWVAIAMAVHVDGPLTSPGCRPQAKAAAPSFEEEDLWSFTSEPIKARPTPSAAASATRPQTKTEATLAKPVNLFDFSEFEDPGDSQSSALGGTDSQRAPAVHHAANNSDDEDDILGSLGRTRVPRTDQRTEAPKPTGLASKSQGTRTTSPPPHILGQIVEMGFSPQQARQALAATETGLDVSAALEMLLSKASREQPSEEQGTNDDRRLAMRMQREEEHRQTAARRAPPAGARRTEAEEDARSSGLDIPVEWQKQADQIYSQASEIGASVFSKANAFWTSAKAQAQRAIDEKSTGGNESGQSSGRSSPATGSERAKNRRWAVGTRDGGGPRKEWQGKPKWMVDAEGGEQEEGSTEAPTQPGGATFQDDADDDTPHASPFIEREREQARRKERAPVQPKASNLWGNAEEGENSASVQSMQRSRRSSPLTPGAGSSRGGPSPTGRTTVAPQKPKEEKVQRQVVQDSPASIQQSLQYKERGNELFKRGAYGEAEVAYTAALSALEANPASLRRVALLNNRANARLKNGDARSALHDTKDVLTLIVVRENKQASPFLIYRPSNEQPLPAAEYAEINLREGYAKALLRRAQAEEMLEQWETAQSVWTLLEKYEKEEGSGKSGVTNLRASQDGSKRCSKMLRGGDIELTAPATKRVHAAAVQAIAKAELRAKERIRSENAAAAAEEAEKDSLRDTVDGRISAWKAGKEANVRALLASLQDVVWPGLNWKKVGMHELVMDNQVKRCYMRAIGKLHPDKVRCVASLHFYPPSHPFLAPTSSHQRQTPSRNACWAAQSFLSSTMPGLLPMQAELWSAECSVLVVLRVQGPILLLCGSFHHSSLSSRR